jgi:hypothetical protein
MGVIAQIARPAAAVCQLNRRYSIQPRARPAAICPTAAHQTNAMGHVIGRRVKGRSRKNARGYQLWDSEEKLVALKGDETMFLTVVR